MDQLTSPVADEQQDVVELHVDRLPLRLSGWADCPSTDDDLILYLMLGSVLLGTLRRDQRRPEAPDGSAVGFNVADFGLGAFAKIGGIQEIAISCELAGEAPRRFAVGTAEVLEPRPLNIRQGGALGFRLADAWLEGSRNLTLRFEASRKIAKSFDAYQCVGSAPVSVAADRPVDRMAKLAAVTLVNPFAPVLFVFKGEDGSIDAIDLLPFPSLLRGGMHAAERLLANCGADEVADTAALSGELLAAWLQKLEQPSRTVTSISLDGALETGLEPVLNDDLLGWISDGLAIQISVDASAKPPPDFIAEKLERHRRTGGDEGGHRLHLPADCIPTISALLRPVPTGAAPGIAAGGMGIVDCERHGRVWSVWMPGFASRFEDFQFAGAKQSAPALEVRGEAGGLPEGRDIGLNWPLAVAFRDPPQRISRNSPFEIASDFAGPLLRHAPQAKPTSVGMLVLAGVTSSDPTPLLESLVRQEGVKAAQLVVCRREGTADGKLIAALEQLFPNRHHIVEVPPAAGRLEQIVIARDSLSEDTVFVADAATVLPDPRTLATLTQMLAASDAASAGCLLRAAGEKMEPVSAGYSFAEIDLRAMPSISFGAIDPAVWRGPTTYPVVASSLAALVTRRSLLAQIDAAGSSMSQPEGDDLLFGMKLLELSGLNLCTTIVSAYTASSGAGFLAASFSIPYRLSVEELARIVGSATVVQRVA